jgi:xanthine dehydrogenase YagR molybdenum-binding subunit
MAPLRPQEKAQDQPPRPPAPGKRWEKVTKVVDGIDTETWVEVDAESGSERPEWGPRERMRLVNRDIPRVDGPEKVTGRAVYTHDVRLSGMVYAKVLRCPHPWAKVKLDLEPARKLPGVVAALALDVDEAKWLGRPVAVVAAETPDLAEDGVRAIGATYEVLPHVLDLEQASSASAGQVTQRPNVRELGKDGDAAEVEKALASCDAVVEGTWRIPVQHHASLETHGVVVDYRGGDSATVYLSTQNTSGIPMDAAPRLGLEPSRVEGVVEHMGGGFGSKFGLGIEGDAACRVARELKRPVHLMLDRADEFHAGGNRSGGVHELKGGATKDGLLVAVSAAVTADGGVGQGANQRQPYIYRPQHAAVTRRCFHTNLDSSRAMRAPGHPQSSFPIEGLMDELAYALGLDPLEFRKRNLASESSEKYARQLDRCAELIGWPSHPHRTAPDASDAELKVGIGFALAEWGGGGSKACNVTVRIANDGSVEVLSGTQDLGTGTRTYVASIVAEELGLELGQVHARIGHSSYGSANGSGGSTTAASLAPAVKHAAWNARNALFERVASLLGVDAKSLNAGGNAIFDASHPDTRIAWRDACATLGPGGLSANGEWQPHLASRGVGGAQAAKVQVDTLTGEVKVLKMVAVQDCGLVLDRLTARSQVNGGMVQALSYGLFEQRVVERDLGILLSANFEDYKIAGCQEVPEMLAVFDDADERGVIGIGEPVIIPGHAAIANAIHNACGVRLREMPFTCDRVLDGLVKRRKG